MNAREQSDHKHIWRFLHTSENWFDGDEEDVYECAVEGCKKKDRRYVPR